MNYMTKKDKSNLQALSNMADLVGDFIRYWGFRKIHGEIWTVVYLSQSPVSGSDLVSLLDVSKALISPALKELEKEGLIFQTRSENSKVKRYAAAEDVFRIIKGVLNRRERPLIEKIVNAQDRLGTEVHTEGSACSEMLDSNRYLNLKKMTELAQMSLAMLTEIQLSQDIHGAE